MRNEMKVRTVMRKTMRSQKKAVSMSRRCRAERRWECRARLGTDIVVVLFAERDEEGDRGDGTCVAKLKTADCVLKQLQAKDEMLMYKWRYGIGY